MVRGFSVLLAASLVVPAPGWAANRAKPLPRGPAAPRIAGAPAIPALPGAAIPAIPASNAASLQGAVRLQAPALAPAAALPAAAAAAPKLNLPEALTKAEVVDMLESGRLEYGLEAANARPDAQKERLDLTFDNAFAPRAAGALQALAFGAGGGGPGDPVATADDGGGDGYPSRTVAFRGQKFRSTLFRPNAPVETELIRAINSAGTSIHLALYEFKLAGVLDALREARARGVEIHIVLDHSNLFPRHEPDSTYKPRRSREIWALLREGFDVKVLRGLSDYGINHNKFVVIDHAEKESLAFFGSYNLSWTAENSHYENANFSVEKHRVAALKAYWDWMYSLAQPERSARDHAWPAELPAPPVEIVEAIVFNGIRLPPVVLSPTFLPGMSIEDRLVAAADASQKSIDVSIFALRSTRIAEALARAKRRGLAVRLIMDTGQSASEPFGLYAHWLLEQGVEVRLLSGPDPNSDFPLAQKSHHKFSIFDGKLVETGSANYTKYAAAANFENAHFLDHAKDVAGYKWVYERMFARAAKLESSGAAPALPSDEQLTQEARQPPPPMPPRPVHPGPDPSVKPARPISFNGSTLPSFAFRPDMPIEPLIVKAIDAAKTSVRMALYEFNLDATMAALRRAKERGLRIEIVVDRSHVYTTGKDSTNRPRKPSPEIQALINEGFDILTLKGEKSGIMHNKYMLLDAEDGGLVMWGSYNFADTAEFNHYENVEFSDDPLDVADYLAYFDYKRALGAAIDRDKLEEVLARGLEPDDEFSMERLSHEERDSKFDPPPESAAPEIILNGERFKRRYFSPQGGILDAWVRAIGAARESVKIAMFGFYAREVADALVQAVMDARREGRELRVQLVLDAGQSTLARFDDIPVAQWFAQQGFDVRMVAGPNEDGDPMYEKQHNKYMTIDDKFLMTGSFNLSPTAENFSFENENITMDLTAVGAYVDLFARMYRRGWLPRGAAQPAVVAPDSISTLKGL